MGFRVSELPSRREGFLLKNHAGEVDHGGREGVIQGLVSFKFTAAGACASVFAREREGVRTNGKFNSITLEISVILLKKTFNDT